MRFVCCSLLVVCCLLLLFDGSCLKCDVVVCCVPRAVCWIVFTACCLALFIAAGVVVCCLFVRGPFMFNGCCLWLCLKVVCRVLVVVCSWLLFVVVVCLPFLVCCLLIVCRLLCVGRLWCLSLAGVVACCLLSAVVCGLSLCCVLSVV